LNNGPELDSSLGLHLDKSFLKTDGESEQRGMDSRLDYATEPVVISGIGLITPVGVDRESSWRAICAGQSGMRNVQLRDGLTVVGAPAAIPREERPDWVHCLAERAADEAVANARLNLNRLDRDRIGCVVGISGPPGELTLTHIKRQTEHAGLCWEIAMPDYPASRVSRRFGLCGPSVSPAAACATGLIAVLRAADYIEEGTCDIVLAGCADASLDRFTVSGFRNMRVLAEATNPVEAVRPFDRDRRGFAIGEGAAMFVLERLGHALARRAPIYAAIAGGISGGDAYHVTSLNPDPSNLAWQINQVLHRAGVTPDEVDYINAHGTGTLQNDLAEAQAIRRAFGPTANRVRTSAVKSMIGHLITAAGGVELAITALAVRDGFIPPTINLTNPDPDCALDCTPLIGVAHPIRTALKLSIAFGGHFGAAVLRHPICYGVGRESIAA
jgi:3-oxoacyl-[acyl-carrier-protein] synthase II